MRGTVAALIFSFFVPALCAVQVAWSTPQQPCSQMGHAPDPVPVISPCCLHVAMDRPAMQEVFRSEAVTAAQAALPAPTNPLADLSRAAYPKSSPVSTGPPQQAPLYVLHATLLI